MTVSSLLGLVFGDIKGGEHLRFNSLEEWGYSTGFALALAVSLCNRRSFNKKDVKEQFKNLLTESWYTPRFTPFDPGSSPRTIKQKKLLIAGIDDAIINDVVSREASNDCYPMSYLAPIIMFAKNQPVEIAASFAENVCALTHKNKITRDCCRYIGVLIHKAINGKSKEEVLERDPYWDRNPLHPEVEAVVQDYTSNFPHHVLSSLYALKLVLFCLHTSDVSSRGLVSIESRKNEPTDVIGSIYCQIAVPLDTVENPRLSALMNTLTFGSWVHLLSLTLESYSSSLTWSVPYGTFFASVDDPFYTLCQDVLDCYKILFEPVFRVPNCLSEAPQYILDLIVKQIVTEFIKQFQEVEILKNKVVKPSMLVVNWCPSNSTRQLAFKYSGLGYSEITGIGKRINLLKMYENSTLHFLDWSCQKKNPGHFQDWSQVKTRYDIVYLMSVLPAIGNMSNMRQLFNTLTFALQHCKEGGEVVINVLKNRVSDLTSVFRTLVSQLPFHVRFSDIGTDFSLVDTNTAVKERQFVIKKLRRNNFQFYSYPMLKHLLLALFDYVIFPFSTTTPFIIRAKWENSVPGGQSVLFCYTVLNKLPLENITPDLILRAVNIDNWIYKAFKNPNFQTDANKVDFLLQKIKTELEPYVELSWLRLLPEKKDLRVNVALAFQNIKEDQLRLFGGTTPHQSLFWALENPQSTPERVHQLNTLFSFIVPYQFLDPSKPVFVHDIAQLLYTDGVFQKHRDIIPNTSMFYSFTKVARRDSPGFSGYSKPYAVTGEDKFWLLLHLQLQKLIVYNHEELDESEKVSESDLVDLASSDESEKSVEIQ